MTALGACVMGVGTCLNGERVRVGNGCEWKRVRAGKALKTPLRMPPTTPLRTSEGHYAAENTCKKVRTFAQRNTVSSVAPQNATCATKRHVHPYYLALTVLKTALIYIVADVLRA